MGGWKHRLLCAIANMLCSWQLACLCVSSHVHCYYKLVDQRQNVFLAIYLFAEYLTTFKNIWQTANNLCDLHKTSVDGLKYYSKVSPKYWLIILWNIVNTKKVINSKVYFSYNLTTHDNVLLVYLEQFAKLYFRSTLAGLNTQLKYNITQVAYFLTQFSLTISCPLCCHRIFIWPESIKCHNPYQTITSASK